VTWLANAHQRYHIFIGKFVESSQFVRIEQEDRENIPVLMSDFQRPSERDLYRNTRLFFSSFLGPKPNLEKLPEAVSGLSSR
jgi:hypothetical protein